MSLGRLGWVVIMPMEESVRLRDALTAKVALSLHVLKRPRREAKGPWAGGAMTAQQGSKREASYCKCGGTYLWLQHTQPCSHIPTILPPSAQPYPKP